MFIAVAAVVVAGPLIAVLVTSRLRPGATVLALIGVTKGEAERNLWVTALRTAGIKVHVRTAGGLLPRGAPTTVEYEVWVPAREEHRARQVLGL